MEIKIDKTTLPKDESRVRFKISFDHPWIEGLFFEEDGIFFEGLSETRTAYYTWEVREWEYLEEQKPE